MTDGKLNPKVLFQNNDHLYVECVEKIEKIVYDFTHETVHASGTYLFKSLLEQIQLALDASKGK